MRSQKKKPFSSLRCWLREGTDFLAIGLKSFICMTYRVSSDAKLIRSQILIDDIVDDQEQEPIEKD